MTVQSGSPVAAAVRAVAGYWRARAVGQLRWRRSEGLNLLRRRGRPGLVLIGAAVLSVAGCWQGADGVAQGSGEPGSVDRSSLYGADPSESSAGGGASSDGDDPLATFSLSANEQAVIEQARASLVTRCMRERGYADFEASAPSGGDESASAVFGDFGLQSLDHARELGYHQTGDGGVVTADGAEADEGPMVLGENGEFPQDVQDQVDCLDAALARLDEGASWSEQDLGQYERLMSTALDNARSSAELAQAVDAWSGCMADRGFSYDEPTDPTTAAWPLDVSDAEKQTAVADVECKQEVELLGVWVQAFADAQRDLIETYRPTLEAMLERDLSRLAVAQEVLATTG